jgi:hypothetical protein
MSDATCISCGMPLRSIEDRPLGHPESDWCRHCALPDGRLQDFSERFERMVQWEMKQKGRARDQAEASTRTYMKSMPAWKDHPALA